MSKVHSVARNIAILCVVVGALLSVALGVHSLAVLWDRIARGNAQDGLFYYCDVGRADKVAHILNLYPDLVKARDGIGATPLAQAAAFGHSGVVTLLIKRGADVNAREPLTGNTPLIRAVEEQKREVARQLLAAGAKVNLFDKDNCTALHIAVSGITSKSLLIVKLLVEAGADVNACKGGGETPLSAMEHAGNTPGPDVRAISKYLRQHGAKLKCGH